MSLATSSATRKALDLQQEKADLRDKYGRNLFGQSVFLGRRLLQAGTRLVETYVDQYRDDLFRIWQSEYPFELHLDGITVTGRADVILDQAKVAFVPGEAFGSAGYARFSFAMADDDLVEGIRRIAEFAGH